MQKQSLRSTSFARAILCLAIPLFALACDPADPDDPEIEASELEDEAVDDLAASEPPSDDTDDHEHGDDALPDGDEERDPAPDGLDLAAAIDPLGFLFRPEVLAFGAPPISCNGHQVVTGVRCAGDCSTLEVECHDYVDPLPFTSTQWRPFFSEEAPNNRRECQGPNEFVTGMDCDGWFCDSVSLQCTNTPHTKGTCATSDPISNGTFLAPVGSAIVGAECFGGYCSSMRFIHCPVL
jgi:hypothetical protein